MPPKPALSTPLRAWKCPRCTVRSFTATARPQAIGPEHPRYIPIREPPQTGAPGPKFIKGRLPVPRDVFERSEGQDKSSDEWIARATKEPILKEDRSLPSKGSREEWKAQMSAMRRQNMREGLKSLRRRKTSVETRLRAKQEQKQREREELLARPEREEDRLTMPSHGLDLPTLLKGGVLPDPTREARLQHKKMNYARHVAKKQDERLAAIDTLYHIPLVHIVTEKQLGEEVDKVFGTDDEPVEFWGSPTQHGEANKGNVWARGPPDNIQALLRKANAQPGQPSLSHRPVFSAVNKNRITRIAEVLTGGKLGGGEDAEDNQNIKRGW